MPSSPPKARALSRTILNLHIWLGLVTATFLLVMAASGCVLVFRHNIELLYAPKVSLGARVDLSAVERQITLARPEYAITRIAFPENQSREPVLVQLRSKTRQTVQLYCDPASGVILAERQPVAWLDWLVELHHNFFLGRNGRSFIGFIGMALFLLSVTGVVSWLRGTRDWRRTLSFPRPGPLRRVAWHGHRWAGLWANAVLIVISLTGIAMAYPDTLQRLLNQKPRPLMRRESRPPSPPTLLPLDRYTAAALQSLPGTDMRDLRLPSERSSLVAVSLHNPHDARPRGSSTVFLDPASASVVAITHSSFWPDVFTSIHFVEWASWPLKAIWSLVGISPILLSLSGVLLWWQRSQASRRANRVRSRHAASANEPAPVP